LTAANFEIEFEFNVDGPSGHLFGDGFAMWLAKQRMSAGPVFGSVNNFEGLGIFFDTYDNERSHVSHSLLDILFAYLLIVNV
jgi:lectin, mannose-binding 2